MRTAAAAASAVVLWAAVTAMQSTELRLCPACMQVLGVTEKMTTMLGACFHLTRPSFIGAARLSRRRRHLPIPTVTITMHAPLQSPRPPTWGSLSRTVRHTCRVTTSTFNDPDVITTCYLHSSWYCPASSYSAAFTTQLLQLPASRHQLGRTTSPSQCHLWSETPANLARFTTTQTLPIRRHTCRGIAIIWLTATVHAEDRDVCWHVASTSVHLPVALLGGEGRGGPPRVTPSSR